MYDVCSDSAPPSINDMFILQSTTPDPLQLVIFIGNTLTLSLASIGAKIWNSEHYGRVIWTEFSQCRLLS